MSNVRPRLAWRAIALLVCQLGMAVATPVAVCRAGRLPDVSAGDVACTCSHADGGECPMHKNKLIPQPAGTTDTARWCAGCGDQIAVILSALAGSAGILPPSALAVQPIAFSPVLAALTASLPDPIRTPSPRPPRG